MVLKLYASWSKTETKTKAVGSWTASNSSPLLSGAQNSAFQASHTEDNRKICQFIRFEVVLVTKNLEKLQEESYH